GRGDRAELLFFRHVARADLIENGGVDLRQQTQLADLAQGNRERGSDRLFRPVLGSKAFDRSPEVDTRHGGADDILADRAHMVVVVWIFDEDVDLGEANRDGDADAARAIGDRQLAVLFRDDRRLKDADGADAGGKRGVGHFVGLDFSGIAGILLKDSGIDATQFHLFSPGFVSIEGLHRRQNPESAGGPAGAKAARSAGIRPARAPAAGRTRPLRRTGRPVLSSVIFFSSACSSRHAANRSACGGEICGEGEGGSRLVPYFACKRASVSSSRLRVASASRMRNTSITLAARRRCWTARSTSQNV